MAHIPQVSVAPAQRIVRQNQRPRPRFASLCIWAHRRGRAATTGAPPANRVELLDGGVFSLKRGTVKQRIETLLAGGVLALALFGLAGAGPLEDGQAAYQKGDYATALQIFRLLAEQRNASAQTALGVMYEHGQVVPQDFVQAVIWYNEAAYQGDPDAQGNLGAMYANGWGVPQDYAQAVVWYRQAGERGNAGAQRNLGLMYEHGQGVPQDYVSAHMWLNLAAASRTTDPASRSGG